EFPTLAVNWQPHFYYIPSAPGQLTSILDSVNAMMSDIKKMNLGDVENGLSELLKNLNEAVVGAELDEVSKDFQALIKGFDQALADANLSKVSADLQGLIGSLEKAVADANL